MTLTTTKPGHKLALLGLATVIAVTGAAPAATEAKRPKKAPRCKLVGKTVYRNKEIRVVRDHRDQTIQACANGIGKNRELGDYSGRNTARVLTAAGHFVATASTARGKRGEGGIAAAEVYDVRSNRSYIVAIYELDDAGRPRTYVVDPRIVGGLPFAVPRRVKLSRTGRAAAILEPTRRTAPGIVVHRVVAFSRTGKERLLDSAPRASIPADSLTVRGNTVGWTKDGVRVTTRVAAPAGLVFKRADGRAIDLRGTPRVWCGPWDSDVPRPAIHVALIGGAHNWDLRAVRRGLKPGRPITFPNAFVWNRPRGADLFVNDPPNEASSTAEASSGSIVFSRASCRRGGIVAFRIRAVLGSEYSDGTPVRVSGAFRGRVSKPPKP